ncbi:MAG: isopenicillin N synthase family dioxygenase, partial [Bacteroidota bacterium]
MSTPTAQTLTIPTLSLADFTEGDADKRAQFVNDLGQAYEEYGFVAIVNHSLDEDLQGKLYDSVKAFFALADDVKEKYNIEGLAGQRGYTPKRQEHAKDSNVGDLKEFYHVGQEVTDGDPIKEEYPDNVWPDELPEFKTHTLEAYRRLEGDGRQMLRAIALYLGLDEAYFEDKVHNGNSILRPIHYFPLDPKDVQEGAVRAGAHEDINLITLLMGASASGLEILSKKGDWIGVTALPGAIVVNVGDMLQRLTNNKLRSTTHRVVNPPSDDLTQPRYSIPFFLHPRSEMDLSVLDSCIDEN